MLAKRNPLNLWLHRLCAILIVAVAVAGCASDDETDTYVERPVAEARVDVGLLCAGNRQRIHDLDASAMAAGKERRLLQFLGKREEDRQDGARPLRIEQTRNQNVIECGAELEDRGIALLQIADLAKRQRQTMGRAAR